MGIIMKAPLLALLAAGSVLASAAAAQEAAGDWFGAIEVTPGSRLPLLVHIRRDAAGALGGTLDSPTQGVMGLPLAAVALQGAHLTFTVPAVGGTYAADWVATPAVKAWRGQWSQAGRTWDLALVVAPPQPPASAAPPLPSDWKLPPDADIARLIADRNGSRTGQGMVIGVLGPEGPRIVAGGTGAGASVGRDTLFEIGSISKVFTSLILADMANRGEVSLDDPAAKYLPPGHHMPERSGRPITLRDLATHHSGLPRMADDMGAIDSPDGPFWDYDEARLLAFLDRYKLTVDGSQWSYSNLGGGLLGYLLGRAAHSDYESLLRQRITGPLGMKDTKVTLTPAEAARLAPPFDAYMRPTHPWSLGILPGAGGIRSSAADMLIFARAVMDPKSPIAAAQRTALSVRTPSPTPAMDQALGWEALHPVPGRELLIHDGQTGGFQSVLLLEPATGRAVVALVNSQVPPEPVDLALHVLLGAPVGPTPPVPPAPPPPSKHTEITLSPADLQKFVGRYELGPGFLISVTYDGTTLRVLREGIPGALDLPVYPEAPLAFFWKAVDAQLVFTTDAGGKVTGATLTSGGKAFTGKRIEP
jgi:CubicO group peptidase (beta-lactamase class C family)